LVKNKLVKQRNHIIDQDQSATLVKLDEVKQFWENNPLCSHLIIHQPGTSTFFDEYDKIRKRNEPDDIIQEWLEPDRWKGLHVLDIGCGNGYVHAKFATAGAKTVGLDLTQKALSLTGKRFKLQHLEASLVQGNSARLPFPPDSFDMVYSLGVLHHSPNTEQSFSEIRRVLRPGGKAVVMVYNKDSVFYRLRIPVMKFFNPQFRGWSIQEICNHLDGPGNPLGKFYKRSDVKKMMQGFKQLRFQPFFFSYLHFPGKLNIFPKFLCHLIGRYFGWFLYASGIKT